MNAPISLTQRQLPDFLLRVALRRPVFVWGPPGSGKSSLVLQFANEVGLPCVSLPGSQLAPEDLIGVPQVVDGKSRFCPPRLIAREEPYCLSSKTTTWIPRNARARRPLRPRTRRAPCSRCPSPSARRAARPSRPPSGGKPLHVGSIIGRVIAPRGR